MVVQRHLEKSQNWNHPSLWATSPVQRCFAIACWLSCGVQQFSTNEVQSASVHRQAELSWPWQNKCALSQIESFALWLNQCIFTIVLWFCHILYQCQKRVCVKDTSRKSHAARSHPQNSSTRPDRYLRFVHSRCSPKDTGEALETEQWFLQH